MPSEKNSLINLGNDITQIRKELLSFVQKLIKDEKKSTNYFEEVVNSYLPSSDKKNENKENDLFSNFIAPLLLTAIHGFSLGEILVKLNESKHEIDFTKIWLGEIFFMLSKSEAYKHMSKQKRLKQGPKDLRYFQRLQEISTKLTELDFNPGPHFTSFSKNPEDKEVYISKFGDYAYNELFAYELRQKGISDVFDFLAYQAKIYEGDNFHSFLKMILIEHKDKLEKKTRSATKQWIKTLSSKSARQSPPLDETNSQIEDETNKEDQITFITPPEGYTTIKGFLTQEEQLEFLSFLIKEKAPNGQPLMTKSQLQEFVKYGPLVALNKSHKNLIDLGLKNDGSKSIIYYSFSILYKLHNRNQRDRILFCKILKYRIKDFNHLELKSIRSSMRRNKIPSKMSFSIDDYIPDRIKESSRYRELQSAIK